MHSLQDTKCSRGVNCNEEEAGVADQITPDITHITPSHLALSLSDSPNAGYGQIRPSPLLFNIFTTISGTQRIRVTEKLIIPSPQLSTQHMGCQATQSPGLWSTTFTS